MIKTLKSELKLRPTYDEMIGMIESQGDPNRPSIESVIDRRATIFRNNQYGSQFDNIDFLGLKKQEENKVRNELRQAQLRKAGVEKGTSTGVLAVGSSGLNTPAEIEFADAVDYDEMMNFQDRFRAFREELREKENNASAGIMASILGDTERYRENVRRQNFEISEMAKNDLIDVHSQSLPAGVPVHSMASDVASETMPELEPIDGEEEEDEEVEEDDIETQVPPKSRKHKEMIDYNNKIERWRQKGVNFEDILFQMHLRGINLTKEQQGEMDKLKIKGKGKSETKKDYLLRVVEGLIGSGKWTDHVNDQLLQSRMKEWREMKKGKGKGGGIGSAIASGAKAVGGAILEAGKEAVKDAVVAGAQNAVLSLL